MKLVLAMGYGGAIFRVIRAMHLLAEFCSYVIYHLRFSCCVLAFDFRMHSKIFWFILIRYAGMESGMITFSTKKRSTCAQKLRGTHISIMRSDELKMLL